MNCPKCQTKLEWRNPGGKEANRTKRAGELKLKCVQCNELWLYRDGDNKKPYQTHPNRLGEDDVTKVYNIRLSRREIRNVEIGNAFLTFSGKRIQLQYKT